MTTVVFVLLFLALAGHSSATWCVCKQGDEKTLQKALDYACGAGADCNPLHQGQACYNPNTVKDHCDYAVNSFFQKKGQAAGTCDFAGCATVVTSDPSKSGCSYPSSASSSSSSSSSNSGSSTSTGMNGSNGNNPLVTTPTGSGVLGGVNSGMGPSGSSLDNENSAGILQQKSSLLSFCMSILVSSLVFLCA